MAYLLLVGLTMVFEERLIFVPSRYPNGNWHPPGLQCEDVELLRHLNRSPTLPYFLRGTIARSGSFYNPPARQRIEEVISSVGLLWPIRRR